MKQKSKRLYEGMYIISATLSEEARSKALERIQAGITKREGQVLKVHAQGRQRLAYPIGNHREGYYFILYFEITPEHIKDMWREYHLNEDLVKFMTMTTDKVLEKIEFSTVVQD